MKNEAKREKPTWECLLLCGFQGTDKLPLKDIRPSEDPFKEGVGKKCT